jgi:plasmid maintenance system antidote protein VapI
MDIELKEAHVGQIIKDRLYELGMKKNTFAQKVGVPQQHINRILDRETMETAKLVKVSQVLGINIFAKFCNFPTQVSAYLSAVSMGEGASSNNEIGGAAVIAEMEKYKAKVESMQTNIKLLEDQIATLKQLNESQERTISILQTTLLAQSSK